MGVLRFAIQIERISPVARGEIAILECLGYGFGGYQYPGRYTDRNPASQFHKVSDISVLKGKNIATLSIGGTSVQDRSPLKDSRLKEIYFNKTTIKDYSIFKTISTQEKISGQSASRRLEDNPFKSAN